MNSTDFILAAGESVNPLMPNPWEILVTGVGFAVLLFIVIKVIVVVSVSIVSLFHLFTSQPFEEVGNLLIVNGV